MGLQDGRRYVWELIFVGRAPCPRPTPSSPRPWNLYCPSGVLTKRLSRRPAQAHRLHIPAIDCVLPREIKGRRNDFLLDDFQRPRSHGAFACSSVHCVARPLNHQHRVQKPPCLRTVRIPKSTGAVSGRRIAMHETIRCSKSRLALLFPIPEHCARLPSRNLLRPAKAEYSWRSRGE